MKRLTQSQPNFKEHCLVLNTLTISIDSRYTTLAQMIRQLEFIHLGRNASSLSITAPSQGPLLAKGILILETFCPKASIYANPIK